MEDRCEPQGRSSSLAGRLDLTRGTGSAWCVICVPEPPAPCPGESVFLYISSQGHQARPRRLGFIAFSWI